MLAVPDAPVVSLLARLLVVGITTSVGGLAFGGGGGAAAQTTESGCRTARSPSTIAGDGRRVDELLRRIEASGAFSGSVLIARDDDLLLHAGYGLARERPCTFVGPETAYHIGSLAKQFAAAAAVRLEEMGLWHLEDDLARHLPRVPNDKASITIRQLIIHTSGLPSDLFSYGPELDTLERDEVIGRILVAELEAPPGSAYIYSNAGYTLLTALIENVSGESFPELARRELFEPADLQSTSFMADSPPPRDVTAASGFWGRYEVAAPPRASLRWAIMPGEVWSTVGDLARWYRALREGRVLSSTNVERLFTPQAGDYGLGWHVRQRDDGTVAVIFHNGDQEQYAVAFRHYPGSSLTTVAATNLVVQDAKQHDDVLNAALEVLGGDAVELLPPPRPAPDVPPPGVYRLGSSELQVLHDAADRLWLIPLNQQAFRALFGHLPSYDSRAEAAGDATRRFEAGWTDPAGGCRVAPDYVMSRQYVGGWDRLACDLTAELGPHLSTELLGAQPLSWSPTRTMVFSRHRHVRGIRIVTWLWDGDDPVEAWQSADVEFPHALRLMRSEDDYVVFDWFRGLVLPVRLERTSGGPWRLVSTGEGGGDSSEGRP